MHAWMRHEYFNSGTLIRKNKTGKKGVGGSPLENPTK